MAHTYKELQAQIKALQEQAEATRVSELSAVIADMKQKINDYGITANDLGFKSSTAGRKPVAQAIAETTDKKMVEPKYKGPNNELWSGRGRAPTWTKELPTGKALEDYKI
jgi:DNA-binding protein H-NS